jgi:hypothetical protein
VQILAEGYLTGKKSNGLTVEWLTLWNTIGDRPVFGKISQGYKLLTTNP